MPDDKVTLLFQWISTMPNTAQYEQNSEILTPVEVNVAVDVPVETQYVYNTEAIKVSILDGKSKMPKPLLTPAGLAYCVKKLQEFFTPPETVKPEDFKASDEDWEAAPSKEDKSEDWEESVETSKPEGDEKWDEQPEDWEEAK